MRTPASLQFARGRGLKTKRAPLKYRGELLALGCRRLFHWPRAPNQLFHVSCSCGSTLRARAFPSCNIARAASLRQSTATRDFRSLPVNGATLESSLSSPIAYCCSPVKSSSRGSSSVNEVGESSPYIGPLEEARFVEDAETSERRLPPTHDISRPPDARNPARKPASRILAEK